MIDFKASISILFKGFWSNFMVLRFEFLKNQKKILIIFFNTIQ